MMHIIIVACLSGSPTSCVTEQIPLASKNVLFCNASLAQFVAGWLTRHPNREVKTAYCLPAGKDI